MIGDELVEYAQDFFDANLPDYLDLDDIEFSFAITSEEKIDDEGAPYTQKSALASATLTYDTHLARVMGHDEWVNNLSSAVAMGNLTVELVLVMDNSGSMGSNSKIVTARDTSKDLVDAIFNGAGASNKEDPVKFALVPFAASVNIGTSNDDANWFDHKGWVCKWAGIANSIATKPVGTCASFRKLNLNIWCELRVRNNAFKGFRGISGDRRFHLSTCCQGN